VSTVFGTLPYLQEAYSFGRSVFPLVPWGIAVGLWSGLCVASLVALGYVVVTVRALNRVGPAAGVVAPTTATPPDEDYGWPDHIRQRQAAHEEITRLRQRLEKAVTRFDKVAARLIIAFIESVKRPLTADRADKLEGEWATRADTFRADIDAIVGAAEPAFVAWERSTRWIVDKAAANEALSLVHLRQLRPEIEGHWQACHIGNVEVSLLKDQLAPAAESDGATARLKEAIRSLCDGLQRVVKLNDGMIAGCDEMLAIIDAIMERHPRL